MSKVRVVLRVEIDCGGEFDYGVDKTRAAGGNPRYIAQEVDAAITDAYASVAKAIKAQFGDIREVPRS